MTVFIQEVCNSTSVTGHAEDVLMVGFAYKVLELPSTLNLTLCNATRAIGLPVITLFQNAILS